LWQKSDVIELLGIKKDDAKRRKRFERASKEFFQNYRNLPESLQLWEMEGIKIKKLKNQGREFYEILNSSDKIREGLLKKDIEAIIDYLDINKIV